VSFYYTRFSTTLTTAYYCAIWCRHPTNTILQSTFASFNLFMFVAKQTKNGIRKWLMSIRVRLLIRSTTYDLSPSSGPRGGDRSRRGNIRFCPGTRCTWRCRCKSCSTRRAWVGDSARRTGGIQPGSTRAIPCRGRRTPCTRCHGDTNPRSTLQDRRRKCKSPELLIILPSPMRVLRIDLTLIHSDYMQRGVCHLPHCLVQGLKIWKGWHVR